MLKSNISELDSIEQWLRTVENETSEFLENLHRIRKEINRIKCELFNVEGSYDFVKKEPQSSGKRSVTLKELVKDVELEEVKEETKPVKSLAQNVAELLERYSCYMDLTDKEEFINDIVVVLEKDGINLKQLDSTLERIKYANDKRQIADIKKYTFGCLHNLTKH